MNIFLVLFKEYLQEKLISSSTMQPCAIINTWMKI